ncbi:MAG: hypothetical protein AB7L92_05240 [Alphaproteobacteria bacterium]
MTEKQEDIKKPDTGKCDPCLKDAARAVPIKTASKGEKTYNWIVYSGINFWANLISSIAISDYFQHGAGRDRLDNNIRRFAKGVDAAGILKGSHAYKQSKVIVETATLLSGGWLLLVPMKVMEDNKRPIVHWLDKRFGTQERDANGKELSVDEIHLKEEQPKQSWARVLARRVMGTVAVIGTGSVLDHVAQDKSKMVETSFRFNGKMYRETHPLGGKERTTNFVVSKINGIGNAVLGEGKLGSNPKSVGQRWMHFAVLDTIFTKMTATIMYLTNGAKRVQKNKATNTAQATEPSCGGACNDEPAKPFTDRIQPRMHTLTEKSQSFTSQILNAQEAGVQQGI